MHTLARIIGKRCIQSYILSFIIFLSKKLKLGMKLQFLKFTTATYVCACSLQFLAFNDNVHSLVDSLSKKLGLLPPHEGGIDVPKTLGISPSSPDNNSRIMSTRKVARIKHTGTYTVTVLNTCIFTWCMTIIGNIGLPVPPRSLKSLEIPFYERKPMTPGRENICKFLLYVRIHSKIKHLKKIPSLAANIFEHCLYL